MGHACAVFKLQFGGESPRTFRAWQAGGYPPPLAFPDSMALAFKLQFIEQFLSLPLEGKVAER